MASPKVKPRLLYTLLCDDVRQELGGKFSLMGLFESIYANAFPAVHPRFAIVNEWSGGMGEFTVSIRLLTPDRENIISESEAVIKLYSETQHHRDISIRFNTPFNIPGTYWIETIVDGERVGLTPLSVQQVSKETMH